MSYRSPLNCGDVFGAPAFPTTDSTIEGLTAAIAPSHGS
jgi:hypothetical protein